jgi:PAS domain S-box-containing protein
MGKQQLRVLIVEDSPDDTELLLRELKHGGYEPIYDRVETASAMKIMLEKQKWDIVLADHSLPLFSAFGALTQLKLSGLDLPFIIVSGVIGEEFAVAAMKAGAHDYIMKNNLSRLVPAIERELKEAEDRQRRKQAEEALLKSQASLANAQRIAHIGNWEWDIEKNRITGSDEFYRIFGITRQIFDGTYESFLAFIHSDDREFVKKSIHEAFHDRKPYRIDFRIVLPDNALRIVHAEAEVIFNSTGNAIQVNGIIQDLTEHKQAEEERVKLREQLYHAQKLESVGKLVGTIAHDFNNILSAIIGYAELMQNKMKEDNISEDNLLMDYTERIHTIAKKAVHLTQSLLTFSRKEVNNPKPVNLNTVIRQTERLLLNLMPENIKINNLLTDEDCMVMADHIQIEQALTNLATNARDAMPDGGVLTIGTYIMKLDNEFIKAYGCERTGWYALLSVSDTGTGIDNEIKKRVFEPFFTTKRREKGTGLGLAIVYGIVKQHRGHIHVDSEPGRGTTFTVYLPFIGAKVEEKELECSYIPEGGTETILIAEDNSEIRTIIKTVFEQSGYRVIDALNGEDAVNKFIRNKDRIQLLVFDVIMSKKNGKEAYDEIRKIKPEIKVLFMSGYPKHYNNNKIIIEEELPFIPKPVSPTGILKKVREVLNNP